MAVTTEHFYSGNASTTSFAYTFPYYKTSDIKVYVGGTLKTESTHYNVTGTNIVFTSGNIPPNGTNNIHIYRDTDVDTSKATFAAGSSIRATDLNNNNLQLLYHAQENDNTIQTGNIATAEGKGQLINTNISDTAAIAGTKINPNFGSQAVTTSGTLAAGATTVTGNIIVSGTVDGRDIASDGSKLDAIEAGATGDQTDAEIKTAVGNASDSNVFTDAEKTKLAGITTAATPDQTAAEIRTLVESATDSNVFTDTDHTKLNGIAASANNYVHPNHSGEVTSTADGAQVVADNVIDEANLKVDNSPTNDYVLTAKSSASGGLTWAAASGGGGGQANQNAFSNVAVSGQTTVAADAATDTLTLAGGSNVTITTNDSTDTVTIAASGGEVTVQDEGSALSTAATTLNFVGSGVTASGTGATKTITISGSGGGAVTTDYQYLELKAHNNTSGAFSAGSADYELVTKGTTTAVSPNQAAAMLISIAGVLQEPNTGTSIGSNDGFCIDGSSIHFGANLAAHPDYIIWMKGSGSHTIDANSITNAKMADDAIGIAELSATGTAGNTTFLRGDNSWQVVDTTIADDSIAEAKLDIHNAPSGTDKYLKYTSNGMEWATAGSGTPEGTAVLSTGESGTTKFLRIDGDGSCSWQVPPDTNTTYSVQDGQLSQNNFTDADHTKLNGIEASATADQTDAEIRAAVEAATDSNVFTDADHTKLNGIATSANAYVHPNHSGEVTSTADGATVIADDVVDEANLKVSNSPTNGYVLTAQSGNTGGLTWAAASSGTITALNNQAANRLTTIGSTTTQLDGEASLTFEDTTSTGLISGKQITGRGFECPATVADDWTIAAGNNAFFPGPMTVAASKTVTVPANRTLTIV